MSESFARGRLRNSVLPARDIDAMIMRRVQGRGGRRGHPGSVGAGLRMRDFFGEHRRHAVGHRPHAFADLRAARQAAGEADIDIPILIGRDPGGLLHIVLADHRPGFHRCMDFVAGAVEEAGVDEDDPVRRGLDRRLEIDGRAPLLVHDAHLQGEARQAETILDGGEDLIGERDFGRAMHFRLDDIDRSLRRCCAAFAARARSCSAMRAVV